MKRLPLFLGMVIIAAIILIARFDKDYDAPNHGYGVKCAQSDDPTSTENSLTCVIHPIRDASQVESKPPWWHKLISWPEGITAWLILATLGAITWQSWETRQAAQAANRGIEVGKTKDRAKLLLNPQPLNPTVETIPEARLRVTNVGESDCLVGVAIAGLHISDSESLGGNGSGYYEMKIGSSVLESKKSSEEPVWWPGHPFVRYTQNVLDGKELVHLHGTIRFKDAFEDSWQVDFHFIWRPYGVGIWFPHLQAKSYGEWEDRNGKGEYRTNKSAKRRWTKVLFKRNSQDSA